MRKLLLPILLCLFTSTGGLAQITTTATTVYAVKDFRTANITGTPTVTRTIQVDPDTVESTDLLITVYDTIGGNDSIAILRINGHQGSKRYNNVIDTVLNTTIEYHFPRGGREMRDSLFTIVWTTGAQLTIGNSCRFEIIPTVPAIKCQIVTTADSVASTADTVYFPMIAGGGLMKTCLLTASSAEADSTWFTFGYQTRDGVQWAGGAYSEITVVDSVNVVPGRTARVDITEKIAGNIRPVVVGHGRSTGTGVHVSRIKVIWKD